MRIHNSFHNSNLLGSNANSLSLQMFAIFKEDCFVDYNSLEKLDHLYISFKVNKWV